MEDFFITLVILYIYISVIAVVLGVLSMIIPETLQEKFWEKIGLGTSNLTPYEDCDEDDYEDEYDRYLSDRECACSLCQDYD